VNRAGSPTRSITELDLVWLAAVSMNASPLHVDAHRAAESPTGKPLVLGALTVAIAEGLASQLSDGRLGPPIGWEKISLRAPVHVGDVIRVEATDLAPDKAQPHGPRRVRTRAFVRDHELAAELITLFRPADDR
jgi:acyl dehydratase